MFKAICYEFRGMGEKKLSNFEKSTSIKSGISKKERSVSAGMAWEEGKDWLGLKTSSTML